MNLMDEDASAAVGTVESTTDASGTTLLRVTSGTPKTRASRAEQLTTQVFEIITRLNQGVERGDRTIVVDFRVEPKLGDAAGVTANAYLEAVRGLVQSLTLELTEPAPAINIVVSDDLEPSGRDRTIEYLSSEDGRFSRGTTYDLRSSR